MSNLCSINLTKRFGGFTAIERVSMTVEKGSITACVGPNGAGKSTLVGLLSGSIPADEGSVVLDGMDITSSPAWARAGQGLRRTFQNTTGIGEMSVAENLALGMWRRSQAAEGSRDARRPRYDAGEIARILGLERHLPERLERLPLGTQRKVGIGVALIGNASYLLLDEPLAGTEANDRGMLLRVLRELAGLGLGIMWIEHDLASVRSAADHLYVLDKGQLIAGGPVEAVIADPVVQGAYWGSSSGTETDADH